MTSYLNLIETMMLSCTIFEILSLKLKRHVTIIMPQFVVRWLGLAMINMHTKSEVSSLSHSRDIFGGLKGSHDVTTPTLSAYFRGNGVAHQRLLASES